jgi:uncharacterized protein (UPF0333 family)
MNSVDVKSIKNNRGQVAVEYILLLIVGVTIWLMLVSQLVSRNQNTPGPIIREWMALINFIGSDQIETGQPPSQ